MNDKTLQVRTLLVLLALLLGIVVAQIGGILTAAGGGTLVAAFITGGITFGSTVTLTLLILKSLSLL